MKVPDKVMPRAMLALLTVALIVASVFAIWPVVAEAPWESSSSEVESELPGEKNPNLPMSTRLEVEDAVRRQIAPRCRDLIGRTDSEFLGDGAWEVSVEFPLTSQESFFDQEGILRRIPNQQTLVAVYRVRDGTLTVRPLNAVAENFC